MTHSIITDRLHGLPLSESDFDDLCALHSDARVLAAFGHVPSAPDETAAGTREFLEVKLAHWRDHGFGIWMFRDPGGKFIGRCGIHRWSLDGQPEVELGYIVRSDLWSQGYATEMGAAEPEVLAHQLALLMDGAIVAAMVSRNPGVADTAGLAAGSLFVPSKLKKPKRAGSATAQLVAVSA